MKAFLALVAVSVLVALPASADVTYRCDYDHRVKLQITKSGEFVWDGERLSGREELIARFKAVAQGNPQRGFELLPDKDASYDVVTAMLGDAQKNGVHCLGFTGLDGGP